MTSALSQSRRAGRIAAPAALALVTAVAGSITSAGALLPTAATAGSAATAATVASRHDPHGRFVAAWQDSITHKLHVSGFAYDKAAGQSAKPVRVSIYANGRYLRSVTADRSSTKWDTTRGIHGRHAFSIVTAVPHKIADVHRVRLQAHAAGQHNGTAFVNTRHVRHRATTAERIVHVARHYLGSRYSYGADGPHAFDCSGYSKFVYKKAHVARLPHNAQAQRHAKHMHPISRAHARPGDLVFYLSGNKAYHVSIYAGHDKQYSATDPQRGVEHSKISSRHVIFKTDWH